MKRWVALIAVGALAIGSPAQATVLLKSEKPRVCLVEECARALVLCLVEADCAQRPPTVCLMERLSGASSAGPCVDHFRSHKRRITAPVRGAREEFLDLSATPGVPSPLNSWREAGDESPLPGLEDRIRRPLSTWRF